MTASGSTRRCREIELDLGYITLSAKAWGPENERPVLALHGWLDNANSFDRIGPHLENTYLVALDTAGHGHSGHRPPGIYYHLIDHVTDLLGAADALGWDRFSLLGHSMGGVLATLLAGSFPDRIEQLALIESLGPFTNEAAEAPAQLAKGIGQMRALQEKQMPRYGTIEEAVQARMKGFGGISEAAARMLVERGLVRDRMGYTWCSDPRLTIASSFRLTEKMVAAFLQAIAAPTLLILGDRSFFPTYERHEARLQLVRDLTVHYLPGGHHLHMEEAAGKVVRLLEDFFRTQPEPQ